ncbi:hypothetical protein TCAL_10207, partial [Tigriopus californicus]|eukprot:TCALIF_10207-PA protein Name:"Protein of unknown function" AED:0.96 eAED:0.96 QI:22/0/0/0.25/1/0.75/4/0/284
MQCQTGSSPVPIPYQVYGSVALMAVRKAETKYKNAKRACKNAQSDGILPMPKSEAVALALKGKMEEENDGEIWIGLTNSNDDDCVNAGCNSNLQWEDGSSFEYQSWMGYLSVDEDDECFRLSYGSNIISGSCDQWIEGHICQFDCDAIISRQAQSSRMISMFCMSLSTQIACLSEFRTSWAAFSPVFFGFTLGEPTAQAPMVQPVEVLATITILEPLAVADASLNDRVRTRQSDGRFCLINTSAALVILWAKDSGKVPATEASISIDSTFPGSVKSTGDSSRTG